MDALEEELGLKEEAFPIDATKIDLSKTKQELQLLVDMVELIQKECTDWEKCILHNANLGFLK